MGNTVPSRPRILFVDAYDSFTNNIVALLETKLQVDVGVIHIDTPIDHLESFLEPFVAVVLGPGPGDPCNEVDVGLYRRFWQLDIEYAIPILGICLGFQSLILGFGGTTKKLAQPRHGIIRVIRAEDRVDWNLFSGVVEAVQYHSLYGELNESSTTRLDLIALAWDHNADNQSISQPTFDRNPASILMAVRHRQLPFFGVQFHPESICSATGAQGIVVNWWHHVMTWHIQNRRKTSPTCALTPRKQALDPPIGSFNLNGSKTHTSPQKPMISKVIPQYGQTIQTICSKLRLTQDQLVVLDSENHQRPVLGRFSILGVIDSDALRFEYHTGSGYVRQIWGHISTLISLKDGYGGNIFDFLKSFIGQHEVTQGPAHIPFWGGLVGCISYEGCLETINVLPHPFNPPRLPKEKPPDISLVFVERSIVISHFDKKIYVQSIRSHDRGWVSSQAYILSNTPPPSPNINPEISLNSQITLPSKSAYMSAFQSCQKRIHNGDSYELCLTTCARISADKISNPWLLYLRLRQLNPAPFAAYFHAGGLTLLSSSPERFLSWSRPKKCVTTGESQSLCQFRPIKGTIKRKPDPNGPPLTLSQAEQMLATPKEKAENLMIVDLIRHDLYGVAGHGNVSVPKLMVVEEYETVFQLVSVIEGTLRIPRSISDHRTRSSLRISVRSAGTNYASSNPGSKNEAMKTGIDVLAASVPPGSMTGAPKLRSCQILQSLEGQPRGIYSGVFGYLDVGGGGDWSVVIRSAFRWDDYPTEADQSANGEIRDTWTIGAGGAITALSTEEGEYEEMMAKLKSTLCMFEDGTTTYA